jgi:hypothetical protein
MSNGLGIFSMQFIYTDSSILTITDKSFRAAIKAVLNEEIIKVQPIKVFFTSTKKILYFDKQHFTSFINGDIDQPEIIELTECNGIYRNKVKLLTNTHEEIDPGTLWKRNGNRLQVISDDDYIPCEFIEDLFEEV